MKVLFTSPEIYPLAKTGGLADVAGSLPAALLREGADLRLLMPAYRGVTETLGVRPVASLGDPFGTGPIAILEGTLANGVKTWLVDNPALYDRDGGPYQDQDGTDWPDNHLRFGAFNWAAARLSSADSPLAWHPDILHGNDWQCGLAGAYLAAWGEQRPGLLFSIHNMVYPGMFPPETVPELGLPWSLYVVDGVEYWSHLSFLKAGIVYADKIATVSPTYAREIQDAPNGCGFEGLLAARARDLSGILNGADYKVWDPGRDPALAQPFDDAGLEAGKAANKAALLQEMGLPPSKGPVLAVVSRLSEQKGMDLILSAMPTILAEPETRFVLLGTGEHGLESAFLALADARPGQVAVHVGFSEGLSHRILAGADILLMPSRFEPCGLTQIYAMRYGTLPVVHRTGGLADTVIDTTYDSLLTGTATGFVFDQPTASALQWCAERAIGLFANPAQWRKVQDNARRQTFDWEASARDYMALYRRIRPNVAVARAESQAHV